MLFCFLSTIQIITGSSNRFLFHQKEVQLFGEEVFGKRLNELALFEIERISNFEFFLKGEYEVTSSFYFKKLSTRNFWNLKIITNKNLVLHYIVAIKPYFRGKTMMCETFESIEKICEYPKLKSDIHSFKKNMMIKLPSKKNIVEFPSNNVQFIVNQILHKNNEIKKKEKNQFPIIEINEIDYDSQFSDNDSQESVHSVDRNIPLMNVRMIEKNKLEIPEKTGQNESRDSFRSTEKDSKEESNTNTPENTARNDNENLNLSE